MINIDYFSKVGGIFALLTFWHFFADWMFQSHTEAMTKTSDRLVRAWHCFKYALYYVPLFILLTKSGVMFVIVLYITYMSHYIIDSYVPVMLWAKYCRKSPHFNKVDADKSIPLPMWSDKVVDHVTYKTDREAFLAFMATPIGLILVIVMDQFFHIAFMLLNAFLLVNRLYLQYNHT